MYIDIGEMITGNIDISYSLIIEDHLRVSKVAQNIHFVMVQRDKIHFNIFYFNRILQIAAIFDMLIIIKERVDVNQLYTSPEPPPPPSPQ